MRWWQIRKRDADLERELNSDLELEEEEQRERGLSPEEARLAALRAFGNPTLIREQSHLAWGWEWLESFLKDVAYGMRSLLRSPALTAVALLSLALGIGANTAIFSFLDAVLLRNLPVQQPSQLVVLGDGIDSGISDDWADTNLYSYPFYRDLQKNNSVFSSTASIFSSTNPVYGIVSGRDQYRADECPARLRHLLPHPRRPRRSSAAPSPTTTTAPKATIPSPSSATPGGTAASPATPTSSPANSNSATPPSTSSASPRRNSSAPPSASRLTFGSPCP